MLILGDSDRKSANDKISSNNVDDENDDNCQINNRKKKRRTKRKSRYIFGWLF